MAARRVHALPRGLRGGGAARRRRRAARPQEAGPPLTRDRSGVPAKRLGPRADATLLALLVDALPLLRSGLTPETADRVAALLMRRLGVDAVSFVERERVLARRGAGAAQHHVGDPLRSALTRSVIATGRTGIANGRRAIGCTVPRCPHTSAVVAPLTVRGRTVGAIKLYRTRRRPIGATTVRVAEGLARIFGVYLELADLEAQASRVVEAELEALRAQISPHFLFNTLNAIAALTRTDPAKARDALIEFAELMRDTLRGRADLWTVAEELEHVRRYVDLQRLRLGERLRVEYRCASALLRRRIPVLVIQPLVENAIVHGLEPKPGGGRLRLAVEGDDAALRIVVDDDGVGIDPARIGEVIGRGYGTGLGIGLANVDRRLRGLFGPDFGVRIASPPGRGTRVELVVPVRSPS